MRAVRPLEGNSGEYMKKTLISVVGPTAIGKTSLAITLARHFDTEIISSDSRQFYKEMQIGTAVPTSRELATVKHHFIQHKSIFESYPVGDFEREALRTLEKLFEKRPVVIMVGGSGLYNDAVTKGLDEFPDVDPDIRRLLNQRLAEEGLEKLVSELEHLDGTYAQKVDRANPHRVIRALEICLGTGRPYSSFLSEKKKMRKFNTLSIGIRADREIIYRRIDKRVHNMIDQGLVEEAQGLYEHRHLNALRTVGYQELFEYITGNTTLESAIAEIQKNTRRFAKRQMTWLRKNQDVLWVPYDITEDDLITAVEQQLR